MQRKIKSKCKEKIHSDFKKYYSDIYKIISIYKQKVFLFHF